MSFFFVITIPAYEKSRSTDADEGMGVLYLKNIFLTVGIDVEFLPH